MPAPKKNQFWKVRSKHGREKIFSSPAALWECACEYFEYCDRNPLKEEKAFGNGTRTNVKKLRAYTEAGLCFFLGCTQQTFRMYGKDEVYREYFEIMSKIDQIMYDQKFTGAAAGLLNPNIIARDLGLKDASDITTGGQALNDAFAATVGKVRKKLQDHAE